MSNPVFLFLMGKYAELQEQGLGQTPEASTLFGEMMRYAPPEFQQVAHDMAVKMGLLPKIPDGYSDNGEPLYNLDTMLERLGLDERDLPDHFWQDAHTGPVNRVQ